MKRPAWIDLVLGALGILMGLPSLAFPYGRDQGLYHYVAREWVLRGAIPYRDVFDHKPPGIYILYGLAIRLFGEGTWGIRVLDIVGVVLVGLVAATFTVPRVKDGAIEAPLPGVRGAAILSSAVFYSGYLNFWDTAQSEIWYSLAGIASIWAIRRIAIEWRAQLIAGWFAGLAVLVKPPAATFVLLALFFLVWRVLDAKEQRWKRLAFAIARFGAGSAIAIAIVLGYFAAHHALGPLIEIVGKANAYYAQHESGIHSWTDPIVRTWEYFRARQPLATIALVASLASVGAAIAKKDRARRDRHLLGLALCAAAWGSVAMQAKFYGLHWTVTIGPSTVVLANLAVDAIAIAPERARRFMPAAFAAALLALFATCDAFRRFASDTASTLAYVRGAMPREAYAHEFNYPPTDYYYDESEKVALYLRDHTTESDHVAVRGFEPEIYCVAQRRYPGRFFWTLFFTSPVRQDAAVRARWQEEDRLALESHPPKFIVALAWVHEGPDSAEWFAPRGYVAREIHGPFALLERP